MSEIKRAIVRLGGRFNPPEDGFGRLERLRKAYFLRRRLLSGAVALLVAVGGVTLAITALPRGKRVPQRVTAATQQPEATESVCPAESPGLYDPVVEPSSGSIGSVTTISGYVPSYDEQGNYVGPTGTIQFWWNLDPEQYWTAIAGSPSPDPSPSELGDVVLLGEIDVTGLCQYQVQFTVPDAQPGGYPIVPLEILGDSASPFTTITFQVTG